MKFIKFKKVVAVIGLVGTLMGTSFIYAQDTNTPVVSEIQDSVWKLALEVGEALPSDWIKASLEEKYGIALGEVDSYQVTWDKGEKLFEEGIAIGEGKAFMKIKIKVVDETGDCHILKQCIEITVTQKPEPIAHMPYITGYEDGTFRPNQGITREELATMVGRLMLGGQKPIYKEEFEDVSDTRYSAPYIGYVTSMGIMNSYSEAHFRPEQFVTKQEFVQVIRKINDYYGKNTMIDMKSVSLKKITRVESLFLLNQVFERNCYDVFIENMYTDINENTFGYEQILFASIQHIH